MKNPKAFFLIAGVIVIFIIIVILSTHHSDDSILRENIPPPDQKVLSTQTNSEGFITIKVTPKELSQSSTSWGFEIVLDSHSVNLDQDLTTNSVLVDDKGNQLTPISWEGDPPGGHHRSGVLQFMPIFPSPKSIELKIYEKYFKWYLKND